MSESSSQSVPAKLDTSHQISNPTTVRPALSTDILFRTYEQRENQPAVGPNYDTFFSIWAPLSTSGAISSNSRPLASPIVLRDLNQPSASVRGAHTDYEKIFASFKSRPLAPISQQRFQEILGSVSIRPNDENFCDPAPPPVTSENVYEQNFDDTLINYANQPLVCQVKENEHYPQNVTRCALVPCRSHSHGPTTFEDTTSGRAVGEAESSGFGGPEAS